MPANKSHVNAPRHTYIWMSHITHNYEWWMSHGTYMNGSCHIYEWGITYECVTSRIWTSHVTHMNVSCHTYEWVMSHSWMSDITHNYEWVTSHIHMNESRHTYMWISHVTHTYEWVTPHIHTNESHHTYIWATIHVVHIVSDMSLYVDVSICRYPRLYETVSYSLV